ncbi:hypothetical protein [Pseudomonas synxantha]|uniref:hypothetical protein n=1 Tax=Pseudomonas synxantha TaxID=47883 RepID=UPI00117A4B77|nr:hypothetical protein [Pseudomonas synxantha]
MAHLMETAPSSLNSDSFTFNPLRINGAPVNQSNSHNLVEVENHARKANPTHRKNITFNQEISLIKIGPPIIPKRRKE